MKKENGASSAFQEVGLKEHWLIPPENLQLHCTKLLGSGGFGLVCEARSDGRSARASVNGRRFRPKER